jgi:formate hydrogenlyase subunit 6/NADH:ubiquinone oxidoreductase subunit I
MFTVLPVRQFFGRINGKPKINILCALCGSACPMQSLLNLFHRGGEKKLSISIKDV